MRAKNKLLVTSDRKDQILEEAVEKIADVYFKQILDKCFKKGPISPQQDLEK